MLAEEKARRQTELEKYIFQLSKQLLEDDMVKREIALKLMQLYKDNFRHNYSGFFPIILEISKEENEYDIDCLSNNLETLRAFVEADFVSGAKEYKTLYSRLEKLCDHLNLEIGRWSYYSQNEHKIEDIVSRTTKLNKGVQEATQKLDDASKKAASMQTELIAVLSIFAGIVFTFSGGLTLLGSVMTSINEAEYYEIVVLTAIICGMVIFNTIFLLMYLVGKITERNIYAGCKTKDCSCSKPCIGITKVRKRLPYVFYFDLLCVCGIIIDIIIWYCDIRGYLGL